MSEYLPQLVEAGLSGNRQRAELLALSAIRSLRGREPQLAEEIGAIVSKYTSDGAYRRKTFTEPPPTDPEEGFSLLRPAVDRGVDPIFSDEVNAVVASFIRERNAHEQLAQLGLLTPKSLLLKGAPGTGKTTLAVAISRALGLQLHVLDLASSISSYLGKTGSNLRRSLDYARASPCVLLLDEFDAIGKRRDDSTDVGELKRIVNVLLKELEEWPTHSVLIAATNHPDLLDPALHRRFDVVIDVPLPASREREAILHRALGSAAQKAPPGLTAALAEALENQSAADLESLSQAVARRQALENEPLVRSILTEMERRFPNGLSTKASRALIRTFHEAGMSVRKIGTALGKGSSTIQYRIKQLEKSDV